VVEPIRSQPVQDIVAYLDGELDARAAAQVKQRCANDDAWRLEMGQLQQIWGYLDHLPRSQANERFTDSTIAMVAVQTGREAAGLRARLAAWRRRRGATAAALMATVAVAVAAFAVTGWGLRRAERQVLRGRPDATQRAPGPARPGGRTVANVPLPGRRLERLPADLSPADIPVLERWVRNYLLNRPEVRQLIARHRFMDELTKEERRELLQLDEPLRRERIMLFLTRHPRTKTLFRRLVDEEAIDRLRPHLSGRAREALDEAGSLDEKRQVVERWVQLLGPNRRDSPAGRPFPMQIGHEELERFFAEELARDVRERLLLMPREEMLAQLQQLYRRRQRIASPDSAYSHRPRPTDGRKRRGNHRRPAFERRP